MALPAHLARYDSLLDLLAEQLVAEMLAGTYTKTPPGHDSGGVTHHQHEHEQHSNGHMSLASGATL
jgi:hypothetical protein